MADNEGGSEQDDVSFLRTDDMLCLQSTATGTRICLAAEGFGNRHCFLENIADKNFPPEMSACVFVIEQALSVRALQEMVTAESQGTSEGTSTGKSSGGSRTLLYGHAVLLRHGHSKMYLACLSSSGTSSDKLAFDVGLQEHSKGETCWWTVHPASKQRSEGEKVRVGDEIILVSVATERYLHTAKEGEKSIVDASFKLTHWSVAPFGTGLSRTKNVGFVFGGDVLRFYHGGDECLTVPANWSDAPGQNMVIYEGGAVMAQARSLWRLDLIRTKWAGGFINWGYPVRIHHITTGRYLGINENHEIILVAREFATVEGTAFCLRQNKDDKKIVLDEKEEEVIGSPLIKYGDTSFFLQHMETSFWLSYKSYETKKRGVGRVEEKQAILSEEGKMDDGLEFSRSQEEEAKTARVIRKCESLFTKFVRVLDSLHENHSHLQRQGSMRQSFHSGTGPVTGGGSSLNVHSQQQPAKMSQIDQEEMVMCLEDLIAYFAQPEEDIDHEEKQNKLKALRNRQDLFQEEGILNLILLTIDKINLITTQGLLSILLGGESSSTWDAISSYLYQLLAAVIKGNHTNCAQFAQAHRLDWLFSRLSSQATGEGSGMLDVLQCVLTDSPEALNMMKEDHIKVIISLLEKHGRDPKVLDVLCSLCVGNGVAVRSSQNNICDNLLPERSLLLQTRLVDHVTSMRPNIYVGRVENSAMYRRWYYELTIDHIETVTHLDPQFRVGWANTSGYVPYPGGGFNWGGNGVGDDLFSYGFDGCYFWTSGRSNQVRTVSEDQPYLQKNDVIGCILDLNIPLITFTVNGIPVRGCFKNFNTDGMFYPVISFSAKYSCRFLFGGDHGRLKFGPPQGHSAYFEALLPGQELQVDPCFQFGELAKSTILGPSLELIDEAAFVPHPVDTSNINLPQYIESIRDKLAENIHEVWAMTKIESGWSYGEIRDNFNMLHPCLTSFERLPMSEKKYDTTLALETLKTIIALGYRITMDKPPGRIKMVRLPNDPFLQSNGYKPAPLDLSQLELTSKMEELIELLAENTHNVWAAERISQGWTYGLVEDPLTRRNPHLVPYRYVDEVIKQANCETAAGTVKTLLAYGYILEAPTGEASEIDVLLGRKKLITYNFRSYRAEKTYAISSGKWYFEVEILSSGTIKVGWATLDFDPSSELGNDDFSWAFDCNALRKYHAGGSEGFGKTVNVGDIIGCMLDIDDKAISYSLNGELLLDAGGGEMAFADITSSDSGFVPAFTLGTGQKIRLIFGQDVNSLKCFTSCGLQEGYQPFCVNMNRNMTFWYNKDEPLFVNVEDFASHIEVSRIPGGSDSPPVLKISHKLFETQEKVSWEFLRLSLPVITHNELIDDSMKQMRWEEIRERHQRLEAEKTVFSHPAKFEQHMLDSGFSLSDVKDLQRGYSDDATEDPESPMPRPGTPWASGSGPRRQPSLTKTKSFDNTLTVPSISEAQQRMRETGGGLSAAKRSTSVEALDRQKEDENRKKRGKSPFKLFGRKEQPTSRTMRTTDVGVDRIDPPTISVLASSSSSLIPPAVPERPSTLRPRERSPAPPSGRRGSRIPLPELLPDETSDLLDPSTLDLVDEYFYGVRIFPGQDPSHVYCGWVISNFRCYEKSFDEKKVRKTTLQIWGEDGHLAEYCDRQNCYMLNAGKLYSDVNQSEQSGGRSNQGMFVGCHIDVATATLTFTADQKPTRYKFKLEPGTKLFPAIFFEATSTECFQIELGRTPTTLPLSAAILKSSEKHLNPQCPPRLRVQCLQPYQWARVPNISLKPHALKLSDIRGWSMLVDDPVSMLALHIPEEERCVDILELIENDKLLVFHAQTLRLYGALCFQGNTRAAHIICSHVDEKQLMCAIKSEYMSGELRSGFADLLISLHLESFAYARSLNQHEFIVPLGKELKELYIDNNNVSNSISTLQCASIRPVMKQSERVEKVESVKGLSSPYFPVDILKQFVMEAFNDAVIKSNRPMRDPIGGSNTNLFVPIIKLLDKLLLIGCIEDSDLEWLLRLIDPEIFDPEYNVDSEIKNKGIMDMHLDEGVKLELCHLMHHLYDLQLRHRVESAIAFSDQYVGELQNDQLRRYLSVKQEDLPAAVAAKKTREFRCAPKEQMRIILGFKNLDEEQLENCPANEESRNTLFEFHASLMSRTKIVSGEEADSSTDQSETEMTSWKSKIFGFIKRVKAATEAESQVEIEEPSGSEKVFRKKVVSTVIKWAEESEIENRELIRQMFHLLLRSYNGVGEVIDSLENTYVHSPASKDDVVGLLNHLGIIRSLLPVQMSSEEEEIVRATLWTLVMNRVFFQHPDLIRILRVHENVMHIMTNTLSRRAQGESHSAPETGAQPTTTPVTPANQATEATTQEQTQSAIGDTSAMVVACCRFLCYFCRSSARNQKAMFQHLNFLLENSNILLARPSLRGSTPLDVASSSVMENPELALALRENYLEKIAVYLSRCGLQSSQELLDKGYPDIGWDPVGGERFLDFFRSCVWVNGESVEENANLVIRLLIRRPECLGPALRGEGEGLLQAVKDSIAMSERITNERDVRLQRGETVSSEEDEDYIDMGTAVLSFYCALVDLLGRCAPEAATIALGKHECIRARAILRSLVPMEDLEGVLALKFALKEPSAAEGSKDLPTCFLPLHKQSVVLFLERVYGVDNQETFFRLLEDAFLPDLRAATMLERHDGTDSEMALALNRYLGNAVLPLLIKDSHYFGNADNWASLMDATLHTVYRLSKVKILTKGQRECVSDFLVALTHEMQPSSLLGLLRKLTVDVSVLSEYSSVALRLLTLHYERCNRYYGYGGHGGYGTASEEERRLTMLLFSNIFDSLAKMEYDPDLFTKALPCLIAIACALPPDYSLTSSSDDTLLKSGPTDGPYIPNPVNITNISLSGDLINIVQKFSEHYHDAWAQRKFENGWTYGEPWSYQKKVHPRIKPYHLLTEYERNRYKEPISDIIKTLLALGWKLEQTDQSQASGPKSNRNEAISDYNPQPVDMSSLTLSRDLQSMTERLAENAHEIWAKTTLNSVGGCLHPQMVPFDLLTDKEKRKNRERSQELLKYLQYEGFKVYKQDDSYSNPADKRLDRSGQKTGQEDTEGEQAKVPAETRFASSLLSKLNQYLETATMSLKLLKPSANYSRRMSFRQASRDIKFFSKVVLSLVERLFSAHRSFFLTSSQPSAGNVVAAGVATPKEKEMVASLFCKLADLLRSKFSVMGPDAKISVRCLQVLIRATDARTVVKHSPDFVKTVMLTFFNHAADDLANCVFNLQNAKFSHIRGTTMKTSSSLNFIQLVLLPVLTALFDHLATNEFGADLLVNDIQVACYKILNSLYTLGTNPNLTLDRRFIKSELDFHRPAIGNCLGAFAATFPVAFLEPHLNKNNKNCIHSKSQEYSLEAQAVMQELDASMPTLDDLMSQFEKYVEMEVKYSKEPHTVDVILLMICAYLPFWWSQGPENVTASGDNYVTMVTSDHLNKMLKSILNLVKNTVGHSGHSWMVTLASHGGMIIINPSEELLADPIYPLAQKIRNAAEKVYHREDVLKGFLKSQSDETSELETQLQEEYAILVRDIYAYYPLLIKYVDFQRSHWLKVSNTDAEQLYHCVAAIFNVWSKSQYFRKEEQNFISANELDNMALIMPSTGRAGRPVITKTDTQSASGGKVKKKKRDGKRDKEKELASSLMVSALKRLLQVGLNLFAGREQELVQYAKDKILKKENETAIFDYVRTQLNLPDKIDPSDYMSWQHYLYSKLGKSENISGKELVAQQQQMKPDDKEKMQEKLVERIIDMAKVLSGLHMAKRRPPRRGTWLNIISNHRKRVVIACLSSPPLYAIRRHRAMNLFLRIYNEIWLNEENVGQEQLIEDLTQTFEEHEEKKGTEEAEEQKPDPLVQLVTTLSRKATTEHGASMKEDPLFMDYAYIFSQSCGGAEEEEEEGGDEEEASVHAQELEKQKLLFQQARLADRGVAEMILLYISASKGVQSPMVLKTLKLGISILRGGNTDCQKRMITHLKEKKDVGFFTSIASLMNSCSVLDLDAFERNQKAEGLGVGSEGTAGEKNMHDAEFTCVLFRFLQLLCEGHNLDFQNYLRTQAGNTTTVNVIIITVDYLLRLQESMMDFYWHYSSKEIIDPSGKENYCKAITVAKQVFSTLTESIQGPCQGNQQALAHSRLWDAVGGFFFLFAHMQDKLSKNASQLDLLIELLDLQKEMVVMMLSMLEGNVVNGTIGRQMVDTLVESAANVELILKFFDMFLKLKELTSSSSFQEIDKKQIGWVTAKDFKKAMEQQKIYSVEEIEYLMSCCEPNHDGLIDYIEFTERFFEPAKEIGFNLAVLLTNLSEHMPSDPRLQRFLEIASSVLTYFEPFLGRIEIMGSAKRVERVYFEIKQSSIDQWEQPQIKESKRAFFYSVVTEGGDKEKLELFVDFCEDAIFEMQHAATISMEVEEETPSSREYPFLGDEEKPPSVFDPLWRLLGFIWNKIKKVLGLMTPTNIKQQMAHMKEQTPLELGIGLLKLILSTFVFSGTLTYSITKYILRFILRLMTGEPITGPVVEEEEEPTKALVHVSPFKSQESAAPLPSVLAIEAPPPASQNDEAQSPNASDEVKSNGITAEEKAKEKSLADGETPSESTEIETEKVDEEQKTEEHSIRQVKKEIDKPQEEDIVAEEPETEQPKAETTPILSSFSPGDYAHRFICFLARNFYTMKYIALMIAFIINFILLFYKVTEIQGDSDNGSGISGDGSGSGDLIDAAGVDDILGSGDGDDDDDDVAEWVAIEEKLYYLKPVIRSLAIIHACLAFCMLIGYYYLKLPLAIFKREKEIARKMEFDGVYIAEPAGDDDIKAHWDKLVISTRSFPVNYWDKFSKKKIREKYAEQYDYDQISNLLGMDKGLSITEEDPKGWFAMLTNVDWKYQTWKAGVTITDQLVLTVMLLTITVYIYTVIAFNFFRKFYVSGGDEEEEEPDKKCHSMLTCFVFNIYQGVRAGGGIGDVIEPPDGDDYEVYRIIFDITFFFFIIVILLAIIQGLIIDAFGELRDQLQSVVDDMEANCFICGIGKDYFDKIPHGFETHVMKEHNLANYLFFLMHLINKPDTDYTGQETYVWELYQKRCWDFFPVGECFRKQYEEELSGAT